MGSRRRLPPLSALDAARAAFGDVFGERLVGLVHDGPDATAFAGEFAAGIGHRCCIDLSGDPFG